METLQIILNYVLPIGGGITIGAILLTIGTIAVKSAISKLINKIDVDKIEEKAVQKGVDKIQKISFSQSIQPLAESELKKVTEIANKYLEEQLKEVNANYLLLVDVIDKLAKYFDNSIAVTEESKEELKKAILTARGYEKVEETITVEQVAEQEEKPVKKVNKDVER